MKLETILNACLLAQYYIADCEKRPYSHYYRQLEAFRTRILRMNAEKDAEIEEWQNLMIEWVERLEQAIQKAKEESTDKPRDPFLEVGRMAREITGDPAGIGDFDLGEQ